MGWRPHKLGNARDKLDKLERTGLRGIILGLQYN